MAEEMLIVLISASQMENKKRTRSSISTACFIITALFMARGLGLLKHTLCADTDTVRLH